MSYLYTSESVSEGHPDKIADQISDSIIDNFLAFDNSAKVACETLVTTGQVILAGEVKSNVYLDLQSIARNVIKDIGYNKSEYLFDGNSCGILSHIHEQSEDINRGIEKSNLEDKTFLRMGAIISSMTKREKINPSIINGSRKKRIASGSGVEIQDVNRLLKQVKQILLLKDQTIQRSMLYLLIW